ncbi:MAG: M14 family zinc carboxypeptidase [Spirochaetota bacterium]
MSRSSAGSVSGNRLLVLLLVLLVTVVSCDDIGYRNASGADKSGDDGLQIESIYDDPDKVDRFLQDLAETYETCEYVVLGYSSDRGYPLSKIIISDNPGTVEAEPKIQIIGAVHGDEQSAVYVPLAFASLLLESDDPGIKQLVESYSFHIMPVPNPWGLKNRKRYTADLVDLNRNFSWAWTEGSYHGDEPFDQSESALIRDDALDNAYSLSLTFHAGEACISTPWDYIGTTESLGDPQSYSYDDFLAFYMPNAQTVFSYAREYELDVVNAGNDDFYSIEGFDWYPCYGTLGDWMYGQRGAVAYTIELSKRKLYSPEYEIRHVWDEHRNALVRLLDICATGISGTVTDGDTGEAVQAVIHAAEAGRDPRDPVLYSLFTESDRTNGFFHLICDPGTYTVTVTADGYDVYEGSAGQGTSPVSIVLHKTP